MNLQVDTERVLLAQKTVRADLLSERDPNGHWVGHLAGSPFATAAAVSALVAAHHADCDDVLRDDASAKADQVADQIVRGDLCEFLVESVNWLAKNQNADGGWSDCIGAQSNLAATLLVQAAFRLTGVPAQYDDLILRSDQFVDAQGGIAALRRQSREDKTLIAAVLTSCALAGMVPWRQVPTLPFELACLPKRWRGHVQIPVERTSLPLLLAVGRAKFHHDPPHNPLTRLWRRSMCTKSLTILEQLQAADDSFLASTATTAFVVLSLASIGCQDHSIVERGVEFLLSSVRGDASWPVQTNIATTVTALALTSFANEARHENAFWQDTAVADETVTEADGHVALQHAHPTTAAQEVDELRPFSDRCLDWLLACQRTDRNALTEVSPGGWAWSDARGALSNVSDTAATLVALARWPHVDGYPHRERIDRAAQLGITWLLNLQNEDGGWPKFYRHSGGFQRDESGPDTTSRALRALAAWQNEWRTGRHHQPTSSTAYTERIDSAINRGWQFLESAQSDDGSFIPLWFGNEYQPDDQNPVLGTAEVLITCAELNRADWEMAHRAARWLLSSQHSGGGWGPPRARLDYSNADKDGFRAWRGNDAMSKSCSVEETALAVAALLPLTAASPPAAKAVSAGLTWLVNAIEQDAHHRPAVIGFYPSKIWYHERLYPLVFTAGALSQATHQIALERLAAAPVG